MSITYLPNIVISIPHIDAAKPQHKNIYPSQDLPYDGRLLFDNLDTAVAYFTRLDAEFFLVAMQSTNPEYPGWYQNDKNNPEMFSLLESGEPTNFHSGTPRDLEGKQLPLIFVGDGSSTGTGRAKNFYPIYSWDNWETQKPLVSSLPATANSPSDEFVKVSPPANSPSDEFVKVSPPANDAKNKYLKYKQKYLQLKQKYLQQKNKIYNSIY